MNGMLEEVKQRLSITGHDLDSTISGMIDDVVAFCLSAGVKYSQLIKPDVIGLVARGVADLWNYGAGDGKFSQVFHMRLNQLCVAAYAIDGDLLLQSKAAIITENGTTEITPDEGYLLTGVTVDTYVSGKPEQTKAVTIRENGAIEVTPDEGSVLSSVNIDVNVPMKPEQTKAITIRENGVTEVTPDAGHVLTGVTVEASVPGKPEQVKEVSITENGITQITPDKGKVLSGVSVSVDVAGGPGIVTIPPVSWPQSDSLNILYLTTEIDLSNVTWGQDKINTIAGLFRNLSNLKNVKWGDLSSRLNDSIDASYLFYWCKGIESIDFTKLNAIIKDPSSMFVGCTSLKNIAWGNTKINASSFYSVFSGCRSLKSLDLSNLKTANLTSVSNAFNNCGSLTDVVFEDGCFSNTKLTQLDLTGAPLSHDCAVDMFNKLATRTNSPSLELSATTKGYLTENEIAIATGKGWVVS